MIVKNNDNNQSILISGEILDNDYDKSSLPLKGIENDNSSENIEAAIKYGLIKEQ
jgi:hypothetical protein